MMYIDTFSSIKFTLKRTFPLGGLQLLKLGPEQFESSEEPLSLPPPLLHPPLLTQVTFHSLLLQSRAASGSIQLLLQVKESGIKASIIKCYLTGNRSK